MRHTLAELKSFERAQNFSTTSAVLGVLPFTTTYYDVLLTDSNLPITYLTYVSVLPKSFIRRLSLAKTP